MLAASDVVEDGTNGRVAERRQGMLLIQDPKNMHQPERLRPRIALALGPLGIRSLADSGKQPNQQFLVLTRDRIQPSQRCPSSMQAAAALSPPPETDATHYGAHEPKEHVDQIYPNRVLHPRKTTIRSRIHIDVH